MAQKRNSTYIEVIREGILFRTLYDQTSLERAERFPGGNMWNLPWSSV